MFNKMVKFILCMVIMAVASTEEVNYFPDQCESYKGMPKKIAAITFAERKITQQSEYLITLFDGPTVTKRIPVLGLRGGDYNKKMFGIIEMAFSTGSLVTIQHCEQGNIAGLMISSINQF